MSTEHVPTSVDEEKSFHDAFLEFQKVFLPLSLVLGSFWIDVSIGRWSLPMSSSTLTVVVSRGSADSMVRSALLQLDVFWGEEYVGCQWSV